MAPRAFAAARWSLLPSEYPARHVTGFPLFPPSFCPKLDEPLYNPLQKRVPRRNPKKY